MQAESMDACFTHEVVPVVVGVAVSEREESEAAHVLLPEKRGEEFIVDDVLVFGIEHASSLL